MSYPVILFYKFTKIADPEALRDQQRELCTELGLKGRILLAHEGINATLAGPVDAIQAYIDNLTSLPDFHDVEFKFSEGGPDTFPRLMVKTRPEIVTLKAGDLGPDLHNHLSPAEWKEALDSLDPNTVVLDVRNNYESEVGRFETAIPCDIEYFRDLPEYLPKLEHLKSKRILMYCTGGIRCEKASALFRKHGFNDVFQLHGGIAAYQEQFGNDHWLGECFVFDKRMTTAVPDNLVHITRCAYTDVTTGRFVNCKNPECHKLFILSTTAEEEDPNRAFCPECYALFSENIPACSATE